MNCLTFHEMPHDLTLVEDSAAQDFDGAWAVLAYGWKEAIEGRPAPIEDYDEWWRAVRPFIVETDSRVLAVLAEKFADVEITL